MGQLVPSPGEGIGELVGVGVEALGNRGIGGVHPQRHVRRGHHRGMTAGGIMGVRHAGSGLLTLGDPLLCTGRALRQFPFVAEQVVEVVVIPNDRVGGPSTLDAAGDRMDALAAAEGVGPAEALLFKRRALWCGADILAGIGSTMGLAEGVPAGHQRHRLLVVHRHPGKCLADVPRRSDRIRLAVRSLGIDINQPHLHRRKGVCQLTVTAIALVAQPGRLGTPIDVFLGLPGVLTPAGEAEGLEPHRIQRDIAGQDHQVGPGKLAAIFLLDRPKQAPRLVEVAVIRPAVQRCKTLRAGARAAATVGNPVGAGAVPRHADEERPVMAIIRRPPILRVRHQRGQVADHGAEVEALEFLGIVEPFAHRVDQRGVLVENFQAELVGPPALVRLGANNGAHTGRTRHRALGLVVHRSLRSSS